MPVSSIAVNAMKSICFPKTAKNAPSVGVILTCSIEEGATMQLSQNSPVYQCQAKTEEGHQCPRQALGYRRYNGELYFACVEHIHDKAYTPVTVLPEQPRIWPTGPQTRGQQPRG